MTGAARWPAAEARGGCLSPAPEARFLQEGAVPPPRQRRDFFQEGGCLPRARGAILFRRGAVCPRAPEAQFFSRGGLSAPLGGPGARHPPRIFWPEGDAAVCLHAGRARGGGNAPAGRAVRGWRCPAGVKGLMLAAEKDRRRRLRAVRVRTSMLDDPSRGTLFIEESGAGDGARAGQGDLGRRHPRLRRDHPPTGTRCTWMTTYAADHLFGGRIAHGILTAELISAVIGQQVSRPWCRSILKQDLTFPCAGAPRRDGRRARLA